MSCENAGCHPHVIGIVAGSSRKIGGVEKHIFSLISHSNRKHFHFVVFGPSALVRAVKDLSLMNVEAIGWIPRTKWDLRAAFHLRAMLRDSKVDLLHIHDPRSGLLGRLVAKPLRIPVVYTVHLPPYYYTVSMKQWVYRYVEGLLNRWFTDRIIYVSHTVCEEAIRLHIAPKDRSLVIENGINLQAYGKSIDRAAVRRALDTPVEATVFCFVGRFTEQKGIDVLLHALIAVHDQHTALRVWLVGDGSLRAQLEQYVANENLAPIVQFLGYRGDVMEILKASDVFVLPSRYEAMPISLLEAMASGLPCIVTDVGDNAKVVEDGISGIVVPPENPEVLATALKKVLADPKMRRVMGEAARREAQQYSVERMAARVTEVYEELLTRR